jgi:excisionase family DNA binding protein
MNNPFQVIDSRLSNIEKLLLDIKHPEPRLLEDLSEQVFTVDECATFLDLSKPTIYAKISKGELPTIKKQKRCYFLKSDLIDYLKKDSVQTNLETQDEISAILKEGGQ